MTGIRQCGEQGGPSNERSFVLYTGKLTEMDTFRVGCIGVIGHREIEQAVQANAGAFLDLRISSAIAAR